MDQPSPFSETFLPNPRGGAVPECEAALAQALAALQRGTDASGPLLQALEVLRAAGWMCAQRFAETLVSALPYISASSASSAADTSHTSRQAFSAALHAFRDVVAQRDLHELACSPRLFEHYCTLRALLSDRDPGRPCAVAVDELALAGRPVPPATLRPMSGNQQFLALRARYERALLPVLRERDETPERVGLTTGLTVGPTIDPTAGPTIDPASASARAALNDCLAQLAQEAQAGGGDPYDFWRLALACLYALQQPSGEAADQPAERATPSLAQPPAQARRQAQARHFYAHFNLVLAEQARGSVRAPAALVRATLAVLWREYVLRGGSAGNLEQVGLLRDYGLSVAWHVSSAPSTALLWEEMAPGAARPGESAPAGATRATRATRDIGPLRVDAAAFEDFLQTADAAIAALSVYATAPSRPSEWDAGAALQAADAAYRLGDWAWVLGLGGVALLADALGLAWRRLAHAAARAGLGLPVDVRALENGAYALRGMLHQIAAGMPPADAAERLAELTAFIEADFPVFL